jgi:hypothetical protein
MNESLLLALAQIGATLAGFAGVVVTFWPQEDGFYLRRSPALKLILQHSLAAMLFGIAPIPLAASIRDPELVAKFCSALLAAFLALQLLLSRRYFRRLASRDLSVAHPRLFWSLLVAPTIALALAELVNAVVLFSSALYTWGVLWLLFPPALQFYLLVVDAEQYIDQARSSSKGSGQVAPSTDIGAPAPASTAVERVRTGGDEDGSPAALSTIR